MIQDKLGYYRVGESKFYSKLEAIEQHTRTGVHPHWDFNESIYSAYNWTQEPSKSISELYRQRAQQLRDQYDYIILTYSGGADCQNILDSFLENDIKLDEVVSFVNYDATGDKNNFLNSEIFNVAVPKMEQVVDACPWIKYRTLDLTSLTLDFFSNKESLFDWIYTVNNFFSPNSVCRESLALKVPEWADIINSGKKLCVLWGMDKPRLLHIDGRFVFRFLDFIDSAATTKSIAGLQPYTDEFFYWTPDLPEIVIKQAHIIKNYLSQPNFQNLPFVSKQKSDLAYREVDGEKFWLSSHGVHTLIYPNWSSNPLLYGKTPSIVFTLRDTWFFKMADSDPSHYRWHTGLEQLEKSVPEYWRNQPELFHKGLKGCWSKDYFLQG